MKTLNSNFNFKISTVLFSALILLIVTAPSNAQKTPAANANQLTDSLVFAGTAIIMHPTVTYNPIAHKYYSVRLGTNNYPLQTWNETGGIATFQDTAGMDSRGIWWNPNATRPRAARAWAGSMCTPVWAKAASANASSRAATTPPHCNAHAPGGATK